MPTGDGEAARRFEAARAYGTHSQPSPCAMQCTRAQTLGALVVNIYARPACAACAAHAARWNCGACAHLNAQVAAIAADGGDGDHGVVDVFAAGNNDDASVARARFGIPAN